MLMQRLDHPAIPKIVDCVETEEDCYLIMEYIKGAVSGRNSLFRKKFFHTGNACKRKGDYQSTGISP